MGITILDTTSITSSSADITSTYGNITGMNKNLAVAGTDSVILFMAQVTFNGGTDNETDLALFIDNAKKCEGRTSADDNDDELGMVYLAWWETGLSAANHDFDVRAKDGGQTGGIVYTGEIRTSQVIEFTGADAPSILDTVSGLRTSQVGTGSYVDITGMNRTISITGGATSLVIITCHVSYAANLADSSGTLGLEIEGVIKAEGQVYQDDAAEGRGIGFGFAMKAMAAGSRTFDLRMKQDQGTIELDTDIDRHMQIVEFTNTPLLNEVINNRTADTTTTTSFTRLNDMIVTRTPDSASSHFLVLNSTTFDSDSSDSGGFAGIYVAGVQKTVGSAGVDSNTNEPGYVGGGFMQTGLSASTDFETQWKERPAGWTGIIAAVDTDRHLQVIEFTAGAALVQVANEILDLVESPLRVPGIVKFGNEILDLVEGTATARVLVRLKSEILDLVEGTPIVVRALVRFGNEILDLVEARNFVKSFSKVSNEILDLVEGTVRRTALVKLKDENLDVGAFNELLLESDSTPLLLESDNSAFLLESPATEAIAVKGLVRIKNEILDLVEGAIAVITTAGIVKIANEILDLVEARNFVKSFSKVSNEILDLVEATVVVRALVRLKSEILDLVEGSVRKSALVRLKSETLDLVEGAVNPRTLVRLGNEILDLVEARNFVKSFSKIKDEILDLVEGAVVVKGIVRLKSEILDLVEGAVVVKGIVRLKNEILDLVESALAILVVGPIIKIANEILDLVEASISKVELRRIVNETLDLVEAALSPKALVRLAAEALDLVEATVRRISLVRLGNEVLDLVETRNIVKTFSRIANESLDLVEATVRTVAGIKRRVRVVVAYLTKRVADAILTKKKASAKLTKRKTDGFFEETT